MAAQSDKTNRIVVTQKDDFEDRVLKLLEDQETYEPVSLSKQHRLEKQANNLMKSITKNTFNKREAEKLLSTGSQPARFSAFIKNHKDRSVDGYPLRPIASVIGTATEKSIGL